MRAALPLLLALVAVPVVWLVRGDGVHPRGHRYEGLPVSTQPMPMWSDDPGHALNRLHALLFLDEVVPEEVGAALPGEREQLGKDDTAFFVKGWRLRKRAGTEADRVAVGGDVRFSPVRAADEKRAAALRTLLADLASAADVAATPELRDPLVRLLVQWDLLQLWWRWTRDETADAGTLRAMARAIAALAQDRDALAALPAGLDGVEGADAPPADLLHADGPWLEIDRSEKALFAADRSLRAARVFLRAADGDRATAAELVAAAAAAGKDGPLPAIPRGTQVALVLSPVTVDRDLQPVATPVVDEVRVREIVGPAELRPDNGSSRDGIGVRVFLRSRAATRRGEPPFRAVAETAQALFLEYGTLKHTTYFAQCTLCHRQSYSGGQNPAGVNALGRFAEPRACADPRARLRLAERQLAPIAERMRGSLR